MPEQKCPSIAPSYVSVRTLLVFSIADDGGIGGKCQSWVYLNFDRYREDTQPFIEDSPSGEYHSTSVQFLRFSSMSTGLLKVSLAIIFDLIEGDILT